MQTLPLSYLIDALAQLDAEITQRAASRRQASREQQQRAHDEGAPAPDWPDDDWVDERTSWYQAVGPLRALCLQRLRRELEHDDAAPQAEQQAEQLLAALLAAARRRAGSEITVDTALGQ